MHHLVMHQKDELNAGRLRGSLDLLVLKTISLGPLHGYGIAQHLLRVTSDGLQVGESALYPALQRLLVNGWAKAEWRTSETGRRARYYTLTSKGRKRLEEEEREFEQLVRTVRLVLEAV